MNSLPVIGVLLGDSAGIGPEIVARLAANGFLSTRCRPVLIGDMRVLQRAAVIVGQVDAMPEMPVARDMEAVAKLLREDASSIFFDLQDVDPELVPIASLSELSGRSCLRMMDHAVAMCRAGTLDGFVFAPFNKTALIMGGSTFPSELEYLAHSFGLVRGYCEINVVDGLWSTRVTSHIPIADVSRSITRNAVLEAIALASNAVASTGRIPKIGVAALNPHAGENGHCGHEEIDVIAPAIEEAKGLGFDAQGPWPADTLFVRAFAGQFNTVVTMYHDQGQIALKLRGFERGASVAGGLPYPIATCTHGTAFDIAGQGTAWTSAFENTVRVVCDMVQHE